MLDSTGLHRAVASLRLDLQICTTVTQITVGVASCSHHITLTGGGLDLGFAVGNNGDFLRCAAGIASGILGVAMYGDIAILGQNPGGVVVIGVIGNAIGLHAV